MRKFVIKNRQKRKYVRKEKQIQSFSLSKTILGMMPILVMIIAFMATIVISNSFRNALTQIHFHFEFPQISLRNPLSTMQTIMQDSMQIGITIWTIILTTMFFVGKTIHDTGNVTSSSVRLLNPRPLIGVGGNFILSFTTFVILLENFFWNVLILLEKGITFYNNTLAQTKITIALSMLSGVRMVVIDLTNMSSFALQGILATIVTIWQMISSTFVFLIALSMNAVIIASQAIVAFFTFILAASIAFGQIVVSIAEFISQIVFAITLTLFHFLQIIFLTIWNGIVYAWITTITTISHIIATLVHFIEIPFKIIDAFWLQIKPYVMIFNRHVQMTNNDFSNGFTSLGKIGSIINGKN